MADVLDFLMLLISGLIGAAGRAIALIGVGALLYLAYLKVRDSASSSP